MSGPGWVPLELRSGFEHGAIIRGLLFGSLVARAPLIFPSRLRQLRDSLHIKGMEMGEGVPYCSRKGRCCMVYESTHQEFARSKNIGSRRLVARLSPFLSNLALVAGQIPVSSTTCATALRRKSRSRAQVRTYLGSARWLTGNASEPENPSPQHLAMQFE